MHVWSSHPSAPFLAPTTQGPTFLGSGLHNWSLPPFRRCESVRLCECVCGFGWVIKAPPSPARTPPNNLSELKASRLKAVIACAWPVSGFVVNFVIIPSVHLLCVLY